MSNHEWRGEDGHGLRTLSVAVIAMAAVVDVLLATVGAWSLAEIAVVTALALPVALSGNGLLAHALRARVSIFETSLQLRHTLGMRRVQVTFPCAIEFGEFTQSRLKSISNNRGDLTRSTGEVIGAYLRLGDRITIATWHSRFDDRWAAIATPGPQRDACDVELSADAFDQLGTALAVVARRT